MSKIIRDLDSVIKFCQVIITFNPLPDEPVINIPSDKMAFVIPPDKNTDPFQIADDLIAQYQNHSVVILVPGQKFDKYGNRKGRGGGWYDRFLLRIPSNWLKVGVCFKNQVSNRRLENKSHDQLVDKVLVVEQLQPPF